MTPQDIITLIEREAANRDDEFAEYIYTLAHAFSPTCTGHNNWKKLVEDRINYFKSIGEW